MADDRIEIEVVLDDGSVQKGFANIRKEGNKTERSLKDNFEDAGKALNRGLDRASGAIFNLRNALGAAVAVIGGGAFIRTITEASAAQEEAVNALNVSLQTAGTFSEEASQSFQELASQLQANSRFGDEVILQQAALARNFARSNEEAEKLVSVAVDLSEATGISLDSAVRNLGKTFSGLTGELGEAVPQIRNLTAEQLKAGEALNVLADRFGGAALGATKTFAGALAQLQNTFGDFLESLGETITGSPVVISFFNALSKTFQNLTKNLAGSGKGFDAFFKNLVLNAASAASAVIESFSALAQIPTFIEFSFTQVQIVLLKGLNAILSAIQPVAGLLDKVLGRTGESANAIVQNFERIAELEDSLEGIAAQGVAIDNSFNIARTAVDDFTTSFQELTTATQAVQEGPSPTSGVVEAVDKDIQTLRQQIALLRVDAIEVIGQTFGPDNDVFDKNSNLFKDISGAGAAELQNLKTQISSFVQTTKSAAEQVRQAFVNGIANAIGRGVESFVTAIAKGENALQALGQTLLATFGDLAIQLGQFFIAYGIAKQVLDTFGPGISSIAAGIGLVALGAILKSVSGGSSPNTSGGGSSITPPLADLEPDGVSDTVEGDGGRVNVTIQGDVFDSEETGLRIADILKEEGFNNAVVS